MSVLAIFVVGMGCFFLGWYSGVAVYRQAYTEEMAKVGEKQREERKRRNKPLQDTQSNGVVLRKCPVEHCRITTPHSHAQAFLDRLKDSKPRR